MKRVAIIGGGISGLACAFRLAELNAERAKDLEILLFDSSRRAGGGTIQTETKDGFILEAGPDSFLSEKPWAVELSKRLGIDSKLINTEDQNRKVFVVRQGRLIELPQGFYLIAPTNFGSFLRMPLFSLAGKIRMISELWVPSKKTSEEESIGAFIRRRFGRETLERVGQPMIAGVHSGDPERLSLEATMPRFAALEKKYGSVIRGLFHESKKRGEKLEKVSGPRYSLFLSYLDGMETLTQALATRLPEGALRLGEEILEMDYDPQNLSWRLKDTKGEYFTADAVCLALPAYKASVLLKNAAPSLSSQLANIFYLSIATINFAYKEEDISHPLDGFGFVVPATEKRAIIACTFSSKKFKNRAPKGHVLLRAFVGGFSGEEYFNREDNELVRAAREDLSSLLGIKKEPLFSLLSRYPKSMVQYEVGHRSLVEKIETECGQYRGLFLEGSAYHGSGIPDCVRDAELCAERIFKTL